MPSGASPNISNTDTVYPEHLSRLRRRVVPKKRKGDSSRYRTQPVTFAEIKEVDEENVTEETASCRATSAQELQLLNEKFEHFRKNSDLLFFTSKEEDNSNEYYWRDYIPSYNHRIPLDAVPAGKDANGENVFIGQTNIWGHAGVHTGTIYPGKEVWAPYGGPKHAKSFVQILCSDNLTNFKWTPATSTTLHLVGINTHIVRGGLDQNRITYIGRVKHQGNVIVGKVYTHDINNCDMVFVFNDREYRVKSYEILTYDN